jgi:hypothetical protein
MKSTIRERWQGNLNKNKNMRDKIKIIYKNRISKKIRKQQKEKKLKQQVEKYTKNIINQNVVDEVDKLKQKIKQLENQLDWQVSINNDLSLLLLRYEKDLSYYQNQDKKTAS